MMSSAPQPGDILWIVDGNNISHRLFRGVPIDAVRGSRGEPLNVLIGWVQTIRRLRATNSVRYLLPIFDGDGPCWRHEIYPDYKAGRAEHPQELADQWPRLFGLLDAMHLPRVQVDGVEADDLIASYTEAAVARGLEVVLVTNDKDLLQLVRGELGDGSVRVARRVKKYLELTGPDEVEELFGVPPQLLGDLLALTGDRDEAPGVRGIGVKTAASILRDYGSLERAIDRWSLIPGRASTLLRDQADAAMLSRRLVALRDDLPLPLPIESLRAWNPSKSCLDRFFGRYGFARYEAAVDAYHDGPR